MTQSLVAGLEPPYYTAVFTSIRPDAPEGYGETAARLHELVQDMPGFLGYESARTPGGIGITVAYFRDLEGLAAWRRQPEHAEAQRRGREEWYEAYSLHIGKVERSHSFVRP
ncbi:antibiotic biosynthesis monooxygenase family protein [Streptomyces sp. NPDC015232]|uniref:antibiotic biosynthesis monooxygenase family protein n=1 Tax=unclassified Streptomyces TaxID=2593676 RepID=UPI0033E53C17